eukprot:3637731-Alexandrium_andersonii.AAC.1
MKCAPACSGWAPGRRMLFWPAATAVFALRLPSSARSRWHSAYGLRGSCSDVYGLLLHVPSGFAA